ncbi:testis-specific expressed protein 55-like [Babylonia areolata]|uniref:testis-specific expressed protein 55-like n=1 Tax=Babylonia areolata TaxID=304850 RepID=UPI003FD112FA
MAEVGNSTTEQGAPSLTMAPNFTFEELVADPYKNAISYLEKHNIMQIFQAMTASIIYQKPDNPLDFMIAEIGKMKKLKEANK